MSAPNPALTSDELTALNSASTVRTYLLPTPVVTPFATARVASDPAFPVKDISVNSTSADWLNCRFGMTVWIGSSSGAKDRGIYYLRNVPESGLLKIGEVGRADAGSETIIDRGTPISSGDYITIWETFNLHAGRSTIAYSYGSTDGTFYKFADRAYNDENLKPLPYWQGDNWKAIRLPEGDSTISSSFSLTAIPFLGTQSVASYAYTVPSAFTSVMADGVGGITFDAPNGFWVVYCQVVLDDGTSATAIRFLWVYGDTGDVVPFEIADINDNRDRVARKATITLTDAIRGQIDSTGAVIVIDENTNADGAVDTATARFCGWLGDGSGNIEYGTRGATIYILGPGAILETLGADSQRLEQATDPANWQQAIFGLLTAKYFAYYLLEYGVVNFTALFNYYPLDDSVPQSVNPWDAPANSNYIAQIQSVAQRCQYANIGTDSDGDLHFHLDPPFIKPSDRSGLVERASITPDMCSAVTYSESTHPKNRLIISSAFIYDGTTMQATRAWSPGKGSGQSSGEEDLPGIIVDTEDTNEWFAGDYYTWANKTYDTITFTIPGNWDVFEPAHMQRVPYTIDAQYSPTGEEISGLGIATNVVKRRDVTGASWIELSVMPETTGTQGDPYPYPPEVAPVYGAVGLTSFLPLLPLGGTYGHETDFDPTTATADKIKFAILAEKSDGSQFRVIRLDSTTSFKDISPTSGQRTSLGQALRLIKNSQVVKGLFLLCKNGIAYTNNCVAATVIWTLFVPNTDSQTGLSVSSLTDLPGNNIGFDVTAGQTLTITATGTWTDDPGHTPFDANGRGFTDPSAVLPSANFGSLIGRIGTTGDWFFVGTSYSGIASKSGPLYLIMNDSSGGFFNNSGSLIVNTATSSNENIFDIEISNGGNVYWLSKANVGGTDYTFCSYTRDNFKTSASTQVARYNSDMTYSIQISSYDPAWVWVSAGEPGTDAAIWFSSNGAVSFTAGATLDIHGGSFRLPKSLPNGGANRQAKNILYVKGIDTDLIAVRDGYPDAVVSSGSSDYPITSSDTLAVSPINGNWAALGLKSLDVYVSSDGGKTFAINGTVPGSGNLSSLQQWPSNRRYLVAGGIGSLAFSVDRGVNWTSLYSDFITFSDAQYGSGVIAEIITAIPLEFTVYPNPVN